MKRSFTAIIEREGDGYVAHCPELDIASQGDTVESARQNLSEALELFFSVHPLRRFLGVCPARFTSLRSR